LIHELKWDWDSHIESTFTLLWDKVFLANQLMIQLTLKSISFINWVFLLFLGSLRGVIVISILSLLLVELEIELLIVS